jgi:hypothetical protein
MEQKIMAIYDPKDDDSLEVERPKRAIVAWSLNIVWDNGEEETLTELPDWAASGVDEYLNELEDEALDDLENSR